MNAPRVKHRARLLRRILFGVMALLLLLVLMTVTAFYSETVFRQVAAFARPLVPEKLEYASASGTLAGPMAFTGIDYQVAGTRIRAAEISFDISPLSLLTRKIALQDVRARNLVVDLPGDEDTRAEDAPARTPREILDSLRLPVSIDASSIDIDNFLLQDANGNEILRLRVFAAALAWNEERVAVTALNAQGPLLELNGELVLGLRSGENSRVDVNAAWNGMDFPLRVQLQGEGSAQQLELAATIARPMSATLDITLGDLLDTPHWQGGVEINELVPARIQPGLPAEPLSGSFRFNGNWSDTRIQGAATGDWPPATGARIELDAEVNSHRALIHKLDAIVQAFEAEVSARGEIHYADSLRYSAKGEVRKFAWPGIEAPSLHSVAFDVAGDEEALRGEVQARAQGQAEGGLAANGTLRFAGLDFDARLRAQALRISAGENRFELVELNANAAGTPDDYRADITTEATVNALPPASLRMQITGNREELAADIARLEWLQGNAKGRVNVAWRDALSLQTNLQGRGFQLGLLNDQLAGHVGGNVSASVDLDEEQPRIHLDIATLNGEVAGLALRGSGSLRMAEGRITTRGLNVSAGDARLALEDSVGAGFDFTFTAPALEALHPEVSGAIDAKGHVEGDLRKPGFRVHATGNALAWQDLEIGELELDADIQEGGEKKLALTLSSRDLVSPFLQAHQLNIELRGALAAHELRVTAAGVGRDSAGEMHLAAGGGVDKQTWRGAINRLGFSHPLTGAWQLREPTTELAIGTETTDVPAFCLEGPEGSACLGPVVREADRWHAESRLQSLPVAAIAALLPEGLEYRGAINGAFRVSGSSAGLEGGAEFSLTPGGILQADDDGMLTLLGWETGRTRVNFEGRKARGDLDIRLEDGGRITGKGRLDAPEDGAMRVDAKLRANLDDLQIIPSLVPELSRLQGRITADLDVTGALESPRVVGAVRLHDASARILALGTTWENVNLAITGEGRNVRATGRAESGDGHVELELQGRDTGEGFVGDARIAGENFQAINSPEAKVNITPDLQLRLDARDLYVNGSVFVPYARIEPRDLTTAQSPSDDQVIVNAERGAAGEEMRVHVSVTTRLGEDVRLEAFGLTARLEGRLTVSKEPEGNAVGNGRLMIMEGQYKAYGQDLNLAKGDIIYTGQRLGNPGLDIRAERSIDPDITAGVLVRGPLSQPGASIYSDPPMAETEALSYLLFGRSMDQITGDQESQVSNASLALNLGGQKLLGNVGRKLGVEEVRVDQIGDREQASLVLGKYLSPDLYVSYGIGLYEAVNTFQIRYRLSSKWTLEATSGLKSSADFLYTIER